MDAPATHATIARQAKATIRRARGTHAYGGGSREGVERGVDTVTNDRRLISIMTTEE